jgi:hypothetical protein
MSAGGGITVNTLAATIAAFNTGSSGNISITQAATPARALTTAPSGLTGVSGVSNATPGGSITITNLGEAITVAAGSPVQTANGPITLAATDLTIGDKVNSGTARTTLANSTAGRTFDLGTNTTGSIGLTQSELNNVTAGVLQVGSGTAETIGFSANVGPLAASNTLALVSNNQINSGISLTVPNLRVTAPFVGLAGTNSVGTLAGGGTGNFLFKASAPLTVGTVDGVSGITAGGVPAYR